MHLAVIEKILYNTIGLNAASIGSSAVMRSVENRMSICKISELEKYTKKILADKNELQELVEEVVVAETWFFRDKLPFKMLTRYIIEEWLPAKPDKPLRILSLPCATGEEPYSIAITLIEAGLMPSQLKIDAFDISERNIERCMTACYKENSFRGVEPKIKKRFFTRHEKRYYPDILIKAMVTFDTASVLDATVVHIQNRYDIVFCRNLLIYFDKKTQARAEKALAKLLKQDGLLFVGHAETYIFSNNWFLSKRYPKSYIMRKFIDDSMPSTQYTKKTNIKNIRTRSIVRKNKVTAKNTSKKMDTKFTTPPLETSIVSGNKKNDPIVNHNVAEELLNKARQLADSGKLIDAEEICIEYLQTNKNNKQVYFLLAIIQLASGDANKSAQYFKKVVYLDPSHYDALMYLSTLSGEQGDKQGSSRYRERAQRIKNKIGCDQESL